MKPPCFDYVPARSLDEAAHALAAGPGGPAGPAKVLAGGQSLIPLLNMRLVAPARLVDINRVTELDTVEITGEGVRVGALARHTRVERCDRTAAVQPLLRQALRHVAHPVVRNRGTVVGSLVHADPAAELPAVLALLGGRVEAVSAEGGRRTIEAAAFFTGPLESALRGDELATAACFPALPPATGTAFAETTRRHGDYALAGVAAIVTVDAGGQVVTAARAALFAVAATPLVLDLTGPAAGTRPGAPEGIGSYVRDQVEPEADIHASAAYRRQLAGVLTERALAEAGRRAVTAVTSRRAAAETAACETATSLTATFETGDLRDR